MPLQFDCSFSTISIALASYLQALFCSSIQDWLNLQPTLHSERVTLAVSMASPPNAVQCWLRAAVLEHATLWQPGHVVAANLEWSSSEARLEASSCQMQASQILAPGMRRQFMVVTKRMDDASYLSIKNLEVCAHTYLLCSNECMAVSVCTCRTHSDPMRPRTLAGPWANLKS